jgi:hypothetical protein
MVKYGQIVVMHEGDSDECAIAGVFIALKEFDKAAELRAYYSTNLDEETAFDAWQFIAYMQRRNLLGPVDYCGWEIPQS